MWVLQLDFDRKLKFDIGIVIFFVLYAIASNCV
ncbi:hypothetical protein O9993_12170 [Vibrio lentus]|nr:hypothetical protein [Vibrio lentus]